MHPALVMAMALGGLGGGIPAPSYPRPEDAMGPWSPPRDPWDRVLRTMNDAPDAADEERLAAAAAKRERKAAKLRAQATP